MRFDWFTVRILFFALVQIGSCSLVYLGLSRKDHARTKTEERILSSMAEGQKVVAEEKKNVQIFREEMNSSFKRSDEERKKSLNAWIEREGHIDATLADLSADVKKELAISTHESAVTRNAAEEASRRLKQKVITGPEVDQLRQDAKKKTTVISLFPWPHSAPAATPHRKSRRSN